MPQRVGDPGHERRLRPDTTRSIASSRQSASRPSPSSARTGWHCAERGDPGVAGAACSSSSSGLCASFHASACSRPPDPTTSTFTAASVLRRPARFVPAPAQRRYAHGVSATTTRSWRRRTRPRGRRLSLPGGRAEPDQVAVEEPLEIRIGGTPVAVTMRTPGHDEELALGFCLSEGLPADRRLPARRPRREHGRGRGARLRSGAAAAQLLHELLLRGLRQGRARGGRGRGAAGRERGSRSRRPARRPARAPARGAARLRRHRRAARDRPLRRRRRAALPARGRRPPQRDGQGRRLGFPRGSAAARRRASSASAAASPSSWCRRPPSRAARSSSRSARPRAWPSSSPRDRGITLCGFVARRAAERLHRAVARLALTGVLLVGGASTRFGSPKALARLGGETLAERAWRMLGEVCDERLAVGKRADALALPFPLLDDGSDVPRRPWPGSSPASAPRQPTSRSSSRSTRRSSPPRSARARRCVRRRRRPADRAAAGRVPGECAARARAAPRRRAGSRCATLLAELERDGPDRRDAPRQREHPR